MDLGGSSAPEAANLNTFLRSPDRAIPTDAAVEARSAEASVANETMRLAFVAAPSTCPRDSVLR
jgi:hypothetical protein